MLDSWLNEVVKHEVEAESTFKVVGIADVNIETVGEIKDVKEFGL